MIGLSRVWPSTKNRAIIPLSFVVVLDQTILCQLVIDLIIIKHIIEGLLHYILIKKSQ